MNTKLTTITTQYSKFSDNQVLTKGQLNQFLEYFEDQDHLTRIGLSGVGIVCGFEITYDNTLKQIDITKGYGVTTDGDLLTLLEPKTLLENEIVVEGLQIVQGALKTYTHYRTFDDSNVKYIPFFYNGENQIALLEIFPEKDIDNTNNSYAHLNTLPPAELEDKVVLLYLENYAKKGDLCTAIDCDNQGVEQVARLRVLLVSSDDATRIAGLDPIYNKHNWNEFYLNLPEACVRRDILTPKNTVDFLSLKQNYYNLVLENETLENVSDGLDAILNRFSKDSIKSSIAAIYDISPTAVPLDFQYRYDLLKDLVDNYNEIKELLLHLNVHCCPNIGSFPKHLLLGRVKENQEYYKSLRHRFYKSPIIGHENETLKKVNYLLNRVSLLVNNYLEGTKGEEIKITPSILQGALSNKAVPFYYNVTKNLLKNWSYDATKNYLSASNLSYHTTNLSPSNCVQQPLLFSLDQYDFLRIEGIQGKSYTDALDQLLILKEENGLNFDVKALSINPTTQVINLEEHRCEFEDLSVLLRAWTTEQECILASAASFFSGFSTQEVGINVKENEYTQVVFLPDLNVEITDSVNDLTLTEFATSTNNDTTFHVAAPSNFNKTAQETQNLNRQFATYSRNVIDDNLTLQENTIGPFIKDAIDENKGGSVNDIKNAAKSKVEVYLSTDAWVAEPAIRDFVLNDAVDIIATTYILDEKIPRTISEINTGTIDTFELTLDEVCQLVKRLKVTYQGLSINNTLKDILGLLINQLSFVCCSGEKLSILLEEIEKRKKSILTQLQLSEFVKKHPGLRHQAGVPIGGTFVMAYLTDNATDQSTYEPVRLELDFLEQPNIDDDGTDGDEGIIKLWNDRISTKFAFLHRFHSGTQNPRNEIVMIGNSIAQTVSNLAVFLNNIWRIAGHSNKCKAIANNQKLIIELLDQNIRKRENFIQFYNPAIVGSNNKIFFDENEIITENVTTRNTVIADFALPYICCSDCTPVNFIVPKEPTFLSLPVPNVCLGAEIKIAPIPFTVSPKNGEVKALIEEPNDVVIQDENGAYYFNPNAVPTTLYGIPIQFTVDDEETTATITVNSTPLVTISHTVSYNDAGTQAEVLFTVIGEHLNANTIYSWNFGDTPSTVIISPDNNGIVRHTYSVPSEGSIVITPRVSIANGPCAESIILEGIFIETPTETTLSIQDRYCLDTNQEVVFIPFTDISPENGLIAVAGGEIEGIEIDQENRRLLIFPEAGGFNNYNEAINFTVNGLTTTAQITIFPIVNAIINSEWSEDYLWVDQVLITRYQLSPQFEDDVDPDNFEYQWSINGQLVSTERSFVHEFIVNIQPGQNIYNVTLVITDEATECVATINTQVTPIFPDFTIIVSDGVTGFCTNDDNEYIINVEPTYPGSTIVGPGVSQNNNGTYSFTPSNTGVNSSQVINLRLIGSTAIAMIDMDSGPNASFTVEINEGRLIIVNTSDIGAEEYIWTIDGQETIRTNRLGFDIDVNSFPEPVIDISLTVVGQCGPNTLLREEITVRGDVTFTLELPDGIVDYCNNDNNLYPVMIMPMIPGTIVTGQGISGNSQDGFFFTPSATGITSSGQIELDVNSNSIPLIVTIHEPSFVEITKFPINPEIIRPEQQINIDFQTNQTIPEANYTWIFEDNTQQFGSSAFKEFNIPSTFNGSLFSTFVRLEITGTICDIEPITHNIDIIVNDPDFSLSLIGTPSQDLCSDDNTSYLFRIIPNNIPNTEVTGPGVSQDQQGRYIFTPSIVGEEGPVSFSINGNVLLTTNLVTPPDPEFDFTPTNPIITLPNDKIQVAFEATNAAFILEKFPNASFEWTFINPQGFFFEQRFGELVSIEFTRPNTNSETYIVNATLKVITNLCSDRTNTKPVVITIRPQINEANCQDTTTNGILSDWGTIEGDSNQQSPNNVINLTQTLYRRIVTGDSSGSVVNLNNITTYINGSRNNVLIDAFSNLIKNTAILFVLQGPDNPLSVEQFNFISKYLRLQIRMFIHIIHCQEKPNSNDLEIFNAIINVIEESLNGLKDIPFDRGFPNPTQLEGTLRRFLIDCAESSELPESIKNRLILLESLITPVTSSQF